MKFSALLFLYLFCYAPYILFAQDHYETPGSPSTAQIAKYVTNPISNQTGIPNIQLPLYNLNVNGYILPIELSYYAGGIKVDQHATEVGLGWSLNAGGSISRMVKGIPDEMGYQIPYTEYPMYGWLQPGKSINGERINIQSLDLDQLQQLNRSNPQYLRTKILPYFFESEYNLESPNWGGCVASFDQVYDTEPDIFTFNFNGISGSFVFDHLGNIRQYPLSDLKIEKKTYSAPQDKDIKITSFIITDKTGVRYTFSSVENTHVIGRNNTIYYNSSTNDIFTPIGWGVSSDRGDFLNQYNSSWRLTEIETNNNDKINFKYEEEKLTYRPVGLQYSVPRLSVYNEYRDLTERGIISATGVFNANEYTQIETWSKRLKSIETNNCFIDFEATSSRKDEKPGVSAISGISVYHKKNPLEKEIIKKINLDYIYTKSPSQNNVDDPNDYRLILSALKEIDVKNSSNYLEHKFLYKLYEFNGQQEHRLPNKNSFAVDIWGGYNGAKTNTSYVPTMYVYPDIDIGNGRFRTDKLQNYNGRMFEYPQANRKTNIDFVDIGMLTKVVYPTGGFNKYEFESNEFYDENEVFKGGGLRIKNIIKNDGKDSIRYSYSYNDANGKTSGNIVSRPLFAKFDYSIPTSTSNDQFLYNKYMFCYGTSQGDITNFNGSNIGYKEVTERIEGAGKTIYKYSFPAMNNENNDKNITNDNGACSIEKDGYCDNLFYKPKIYLFPAMGAFHLEPQVTYLNPIVENSYPFPPDPNYNWNRGHLLKKEYYDELGFMIKDETYTYSNYSRGVSLHLPNYVYGLKIARVNLSNIPTISNRCDKLFFKISKYAILTDIIKLPSAITEKIYSREINQETIINRTEMFYGSPFHTNITTKVNYSSSGSKMETEFKYPSDYDIDPDLAPLGNNSWFILRNMFSMNSEPIEIINYKYTNGIRYLNQATLKSFINGTKKSLLNEISTFETTSGVTDYNNIKAIGPNISVDHRYKVHTKFSDYNSAGKPQRVIVNNSAVTCYLYDYKDQYPIAKIENANLNDIAYTGFETDGLGGWTFEGIRILKDANENRYFSSVPEGEGVISKTGLDPAKTYIVSMRYKGFGSGKPLGFTMVSGPDKDGWSLYQRIFTGSSSFRFEALPCFIDDIKLYPKDAQMTTYTYKPLVGITSITDPKGLTTTYEYDGFQRLKLIKDHKGNVLNTTEYHYKP